MGSRGPVLFTLELEESFFKGKKRQSAYGQLSKFLGPFIILTVVVLLKAEVKRGATIGKKETSGFKYDLYNSASRFSWN